MEIVTIPCLQDNFAYLLICPHTGEAAVVDPSEADPVRKEINRQKVKLTTILNTHHHWDHVGGNNALRDDWPGLKIFGHFSDTFWVTFQSLFNWFLIVFWLLFGHFSTSRSIFCNFRSLFGTPLGLFFESL